MQASRSTRSTALQPRTPDNVICAIIRQMRLEGHAVLRAASAWHACFSRDWARLPLLLAPWPRRAVSALPKTHTPFIMTRRHGRRGGLRPIGKTRLHGGQKILDTHLSIAPAVGEARVGRRCGLPRRNS